ncbi:MAG TPA: hypothetical protein VMW65_05650 [Chloroflexota bacterium]|nr:hypothetical protein [Chloroflexota bacterium]
MSSVSLILSVSFVLGVLFTLGLRRLTSTLLAGNASSRSILVSLTLARAGLISAGALVLLAWGASPALWAIPGFWLGRSGVVIATVLRR